MLKGLLWVIVAALSLLGCRAGTRGESERASEPSALDAAELSPEFPVEHPRYWSPSNVYEPSVAFGSSSYLVAYTDYEAGQLAVTRVSADGEILDPVGIELASGALRAFVVYAGAHWVVLWKQDTALRCARVRDDGVVVDPEGIDLGPSVAVSEALFDGEHVVVVGGSADVALVSPDCTSVGETRVLAPNAGKNLTRGATFDGQLTIILYSQELVGSPDELYAQAVNASAEPVAARVLVARAAWTRTEVDTEGVSGVRGDIAASNGITRVAYTFHDWSPETRTGTEGSVHYRSLAGDVLGAPHELAGTSSPGPRIEPTGHGVLITSDSLESLVLVRTDGTEIQMASLPPGIEGLGGFTSFGHTSTDLLFIAHVLAYAPLLEYRTRVWAYTEELALRSGPTPLMLAAEPSHLPAVASNGDVSLVVWANAWFDSPSGLRPNADIFGSRVASSGEILDPEPILIAATGNRTTDRRTLVVQSNGTDFLVAWDVHGDGNQSQIYARRVSRDGVLLDAEPIPVATERGNTISDMRTFLTLASNGSDYLLAWQHARALDKLDLRTARISQQGERLDLEPPASAAPQCPIGLTHTGTEYLAAVGCTSDGAEPIRIFRFDADATVASTIETAWVGKVFGLQSDGTRTFMLFGDRANLNVARFTPGSPLVASAVTRVTSTFEWLQGRSPSAALGWDGLHPWVLWRESSGSSLAARVAQDGSMLDAGGLLLASDERAVGSDAAVAVTSYGNPALAVYSRFGDQRGFRDLRLQGRWLPASDGGGAGGGSNTGGSSGEDGSPAGGSSGEDGSPAGGSSGEQSSGAGQAGSDDPNVGGSEGGEASGHAGSGRAGAGGSGAARGGAGGNQSSGGRAGSSGGIKPEESGCSCAVVGASPEQPSNSSAAIAAFGLFALLAGRCRRKAR